MKKNILIITGGTGGHVIPAKNLAVYLKKQSLNCKLITDKRGYNYLNDFEGSVKVILSSNLNGNLISKFFGIISLLIGFVQSFILIISFKPNYVISFGSYASFSPMLSILILKLFFRTKLFIHEQNSIIGRTNKFFLFFCNKIFFSFNISSKIKNNIKNKIHIVGTPENNSSNYSNKPNKNKLIILIFGGSQGSEFVSKFSVKLIKLIYDENIINPEYFFQCPVEIIKKVNNDLKKLKCKVTIKNYFENIDEILQKTSIAVSRAGAGSINDLIKYKIPSVLIPLPTAKDNHQFHNATLLKKHKLAIIINEADYNIVEAKNFIYEFYKNTKKNKLINDRFNKITIKNSNSLIYKLITK